MPNTTSAGQASAHAPTVVIAVAELFAGLGSANEPLTVALFVIVGPAVTLTISVIVAELPRVIVPTVQLTGPELPGAGAVKVPWLTEAETKAVPVGTDVLNATFVAGCGPPLVTVIV